MLKELFDKGRCALGFHAEAWAYAGPGSCEQTSTCARCGAVARRVEHAWPAAWTPPAPGECQARRVCFRCGEEETRAEHDWGDPQYVSDDSCETVSVCSRCDAEVSGDVVHDFNTWTYDGDEACTQSDVCARCGTPGSSRRTHHDWTPWQHSPFYETRVRVCRRCGEMPFDVDPGTDDDPLSLQKVMRAVQDVAGAEEVPELRRRLMAHQPELWSPAADRYFRFALAHVAGDAARTETLDVLQRLIARCRAEGIDAVLAPAMPQSLPPPVPQTASDGDAHLPGHWRHTESFASGGVSLATDTHLVLDGSGRFAWWSKSAGSMGSSEGGREQGRWSAADGVLRLVFDDGTTRSFAYEVDADTLFAPGESRYRLWHRIGGA